MFDHQTLVIAHKVIQRGEPEELAALFVINSAIRERLSRQCHLFHLPRPLAGNGQAAVRLSSCCSDQQSPTPAVAAAYRRARLLALSAVKAAIVDGTLKHQH